MTLILNIDTSTDFASIALAKDGELLNRAENRQQKDHAAWIQEAIQKLMKDSGYKLNELSALAVTNGPGSYTGLRVGLATAKGLCYGLNIPLITIGTLYVMALSANKALSGLNLPTTTLLCPMIDARRREVFTALYNVQLDEIISPNAMILDPSSFDKELDEHQILFFGSGSLKWKELCKNANARFADVNWDSSSMILPSYHGFREKKFADISYSEPAYLKEFYIHQS